MSSFINVALQVRISTKSYETITVILDKESTLARIQERPEGVHFHSNLVDDSVMERGRGR